MGLCLFFYFYCVHAELVGKKVGGKRKKNYDTNQMNNEGEKQLCNNNSNNTIRMK